MRNKGEVVTGFIVAATIIFALTATGLYKTKENGVLENNMNKIWCKMQNKGEAFCNAEYPNPV